MSIRARKVPDALMYALVAAHNLEVRERVSSATTYPHADVTSVTGGNYTAPTTTPLLVVGSAVDLPSTVAVAESARHVLAKHFAEAGTLNNLYGGPHKAADTVNAVLIALAAAPLSVDLPSVLVVLNAEKVACNAHVSQAGAHFHNDGVNSVTAANASDLPSAEALATAIAAFALAHFAFAGTTQTVTAISA
jgi:uncharacterized protein YejL (UPF0352 family)